MGNTKQDLKIEWTGMGKSYWAEDAIYAQFLMDKFKELVPAHGIADTVHGEMTRCFHKLQYEYCNNGNGNARDVNSLSDTCWDCGGNGEDEEGELCDNCYGSGEDMDAIEEVEMDKFFEKYLDYLGKYIDHELTEDVRNMILGSNHDNFTDEYMHKYTKLGDAVAHYIISTENKASEIKDYYQ